ncbi:MAG TPA: DUF1385 domain-containing protein [Candidatus Limiplasma sp.]|nr:DUF1385 domain-containing protein [Candidatus Limiplasma sp.]
MKDKQQCKFVDIGGQAVLEGVMMKSPDAIAVAVRRPDKSIVVDRQEYVAPAKKHKWMGWPFVRGIINMGSMLAMGMGTLQKSTNMLGVLDEEPSKFEIWLSKKLGKGIDKIVMGTAIVLATVLSVVLFFAIPEAFARWLKAVWADGNLNWLVNLLSGILRIMILIGYILFCMLVPDVRRTFQYHGSEHKTVYCHEHKKQLTPENARVYSTLHPRCGTSFLLLVFVISIILFTVIGYQGNVYVYRLLSRLALLPIVAGVSYEVLKVLAHSESWIARALRWPGLQLQRLTTKQPDDGMLEVAIVSMNVALHGMPKHAEHTPEGWAILKSYRESDPDYVPETAAEPEIVQEPETAPETADAEEPAGVQEAI